ncbi:MAG: hypothetical protein AB1401_10205 [Thermodesulfobacteriota bacterium]
MDIKELLKKNGPMLSSSIKQTILASGLSDEAARKQISRVSKQVKKLHVKLFPRRAYFFYLEDQENTTKFFENLVAALKETNSIHYGAIVALAARGGKASLEKFKVLSGAPEKRKKQKNFNLLVSELINSKLAFKKNEGGVELIELNINLASCFNKDKIEVLEVLEELIVAAMTDWLKKTGLGSYNKLKRSSDFNSYYWDITVPSYVFPFCIKKENVKPGFIVVDILPQYNIQTEHIKYFIKKFESSRSQYPGRFFPILIGNNFEPDAFTLGKKSGFLITTPGNLFGDSVGALLSDLKNTLENMSAAATKKSEEEISKMIRSVAKLEGKSNNIRGQLFELVAGHIVSKAFSGYVDIRKKIHDQNGRKAEIDVICFEGSKAIRIFECKGNNANQVIDLPTIQEWETKINIIRNWLDCNNEYRSRKQYFEFWTTSSFKPEAISYLDKVKASVRKYTVDYKASNGVLAMAKNENLNSIHALLLEHYGAE